MELPVLPLSFLRKKTTILRITMQQRTNLLPQVCSGMWENGEGLWIIQNTIKVNPVVGVRRIGYGLYMVEEI